jgi:hypothetical protein
MHGSTNLKLCPSRFSSRIFSSSHLSQGNISHNSFIAFSSSFSSACSALSFSEIILLYPDKGGSNFSITSVPIYQTTRRHVLAVYNFCIYIYIHFFFCLTEKRQPNAPPDAWPSFRRTPHVGDV